MKYFFYNRRTLAIIAVVWFFCMIFYIKWNKYDALISDPGAYIYYAKLCAEQGTMYPNTSLLHSSYIFNPGWVNFIVLWINIFGSVRYLVYMNAFFNIAILSLIYVLCRRLFANCNIAYTAAYMYMILPSFFTISNHTFSELYFILWSLLALYFAVRGGKWTYVAGLASALAMWTRPIALGWLVACLFWFLWKRYDWCCTVRYIASYVIVCALVAVCTHRDYPDYVYKANTGGVNLIMGANDHATGQYCVEAFNPVDGLGYIEYPEKYTVNQKDSIWKQRAIQWIIQHPKTYVWLTVKKLFQLYIVAPSFTYTYKSLPEGRYSSSSVYDKMETAYPFNLQGIWQNQAFLCFHFHIAIMLLSLFGLFRYARKKRELCMLYIPIILCTAMTIATVGAPRYNVVMLPLIIMTAAYTLHCSIQYFFPNRGKAKMS